MTKIPREAGLRSDGELVQGGADTFVFAPVREDASASDSAHGGWIDILTMSPPPPTRAAQSGGDDDDDDGLPPTLDWGIDGDGPGDQGHGGWCDLLSTGGGRAVAEEDDDGQPVTPVWDLG